MYFKSVVEADLSLTEAISEKSWWFLAYISNLGLGDNWNYTDYNAGMQKCVYG